jgi:hypothetical protein
MTLCTFCTPGNKKIKNTLKGRMKEAYYRAIRFAEEKSGLYSITRNNKRIYNENRGKEGSYTENKCKGSEIWQW